MKIVNIYKADNGDLFVQHNGSELENASREMFESNLENMINEFGKENIVECKMVESEKFFSHINYYTQDGQFIATAGIHITDEYKACSDFVFLKRKSLKKKLEAMYKRTLKNCGVQV